VFPTGKGSTVGSYTMYRMKKNNTAPVAIVNNMIDTIVAVGCIISEIPCVDKIDINNIRTGQKVFVNGSEGVVEVR
ncbi:MAG: aconitase X swivel domain-containing protein, partial [Candidatus Hodarchaeota archaeon]